MNEPEHTANKSEGTVSGFLLQAGTVHGGIHIHGSPAPPAPQSDDPLGALVDALLAVPSISDEPGRRLVLSRMRREIAHAVPHHQEARRHVIQLVLTCRNYDNGLGDLLRVLRELEGDSIPVRRSAEAMRALAEQNQGD